MLHPSLEEVRRRAHEGTMIPVYLELLADMETPVSAFVKLGGGDGSFLLESVEGGGQLGRYSFIGLEPDSTLLLGEGWAERRGELGEGRVSFSDPLALIDGLLRREAPIPVDGLPRFHGGAVGYLSYDLARYFERLPRPAGEGLPLPLGRLGWYKTVLAFDHLRRTVKLITHVATGGALEAAYREAKERLEELAARLRSPKPLSAYDLAGVAGAADGQGEGEVRANVPRGQFEDSVRRAKEYIAAGDALQVVLSQRLSVPTRATAFSIYRTLRSINPSPYMYYLDYGRFQIVGASPEMLIRVEDGVVSVHPIAGTRRRGRTAEEDERLAVELAADEKEKAEHFMLVDLGRNDVGRVSEPGSVRVTQRMEVERYSHVMHLVSHVEGRLRRDLRPVDALRAGFPAGTVSGAPKIRAMEIISELEPDGRGPYAGAVGYFGFGGNLDTAIAIRTVVVMDGISHLQVGAGIVADSVPEMEYQESMNKAAALLRAVGAAEGVRG
ncbi:MAG: anthranilate synthase component I [Chloroflexota bacterium]